MAEEQVPEKIEVASESPIGDEPPVRSAGIIAQLLGLLKKFSIGQEMTSNSISMPDGFEGKDTGIERFQVSSLRHSDILLKVNDLDDPVLRLIEVVKWVFTLGQAFQSKKPLNPVLGEVSVCKYYSNQPKEGSKNNGKHTKDDEKDVFYSLAEQVSHHPPMSAYLTENKERGIRIAGYSKASIKFLGTAVKLALEGHTKVTFDKLNETYTYVPPSVMIRFVGFVLEYSGKTEIKCNNHPYVARISYKEKPYLRGKYHSLKGKIVKVNKENPNKKDEEIVVKFKGHWNEEVVFEDLRNNKTYTFDAKEYPATGLPIYPLSENDLPTSSRKVWHALKTAPDSSTASKAKKEVEEEQRRKAKERTEKGETHKPQYFVNEEIDGAQVWKPNPDILQGVVF